MRTRDSLRRTRNHARATHAGSRIAAAVLVLVALTSASASRFGASSPAAAPSPPTLRSASAADNGATSASLTLSRPAGVSSGDVLVAAVAARVDSGAAFAQVGWAQVRRDDCSGPNQTQLAQALYVRVATGSEPSSYTFSFPQTTGAAGSVLAYRGADAARPVDTNAGKVHRNSSWSVAPSVTPTVEASRLVAAFAHSGSSGVTVTSDVNQQATSSVSTNPTVRATTADRGLTSTSSTKDVGAKAPEQQSCSIGGALVLRPAANQPDDDPPPPPPPPAAACADGVDNDGDGRVDYPADPGCSSPSDNDESNTAPPPAPACSDTRDNDADGRIDYPADTGCSSSSDNDESNPAPPPAPACSDTRDNDADARVDYPADPGCTGPNDGDETDPAPPPPPPPPSGGERIITNGQWVCDRAVDIDLLKITMNNGSQDALVLATNCTGRIDRVEIEGPMADGIKVQNNSVNAAHDLVIGGGYVSCGQAAPGVHQDGMQAMGGRNIRFENLVIDCLGGGGGNFFPARGGSGATTPTSIVCVRCAFGPRHPNNVQIQTSNNSGIVDSLVCRPTSGRDPIMIGSSAVNPINENSLIVPSNDSRCTPSGLRAWADG